MKHYLNLSGKNYSLDSLNLLLLEIEKIASTKLYDFIDAEIEESIVFDNKINLTISVKDSKKYYVERVNIIGNYNTIEEVIRNNLIVDEGDPINSLLLNKSIDNIRSLGIFKSVKNKIIDGSEDNLKKIEITVEEKPTGEISLGAGYGTNGATLAAGVIEKNFLGKGINLNTNIEINEDSLKGKFVYSKPNFAYTDNTLFTSLRSDTNDFLTDSGYKVSNLGFSVGTKYEQYENFYFNPELDISHQNLETNSTASQKIKDQKGKYNDLYFNYGLNYDLRDSRYNPTSGKNIFFYQNLPIISDGNELENTFSLTTYKKLSQNSDMIGKVSFYLKNIDTLDGSDVRISKRVNVPYNRLRGFEKGKVGPVENSDFIGGNYVSSLNISANLPQILLELENVELNYFIDIANVWGVDYDSSIDDSNVVRSSTGIGVDFLTPIGPLSFSLAQPITKKSTDKTESFRFNIGTTF
jgi:outer membrane protein insertion porin family